MRGLLSENPFKWTDPGTWPWVVYVWIALAVASFVKPVWQWLRRHRAGTWPPTEGRIESTEVTQTKRVFDDHIYRGEIKYSYSAHGNSYSGKYTREFRREDEACEFIRDLKGKTVTVLHNPSRPSASTLSESSVETLLQVRAPNPSPVMAAESVPAWLKPWMIIFTVLSAAGLLLSLWVHLGAVMGRRVAPEGLFFLLHIGIFVVWFPAVFVAQRRVGGTAHRDYWKLALKGSPDGMRYMVYGFLGYAMVNFALFIANSPSGHTGANPPAAVWRGFSGHWMAFYSAAFAILYSAQREPEIPTDPPRLGL